MATWTVPKEWADTNLVNGALMNQYVSENQRYLFERPRDILNLRDVGNFSTSSTTFVIVSATSLRLNITLQAQADVRLWCNTTGNIDNGNLRYGYLDVLMDGVTYISSDDTTPVANGLMLSNNDASSGAAFPMAFDIVYQNVPAGSHFFDLYYRVNANNLTLYTDPAMQFGIMEV